MAATQTMRKSVVNKMSRASLAKAGPPAYGDPKQRHAGAAGVLLLSIDPAARLP
jgi:hypothetical protein